MEKQYNFYNLEASFKNFLLAGNKTPATIKNYLSDLRHFLGWIVLKYKTQNSKFELNAEPNNLVQIITFESLNEYRAYLNENHVPKITVKRRISTLAKFCSFCISQGWLTSNPIKQIRINDNEIKANPFKTIVDEYKNKASLEDYNNINDFISFINS